MADAAAQRTFADRFIDPPTKTEWVLTALAEVVLIVGLLTGVLGVAWLIAVPTVGWWTMHSVFVALRVRRESGGRQPSPS